jgi:Subtilase family
MSWTIEKTDDNKNDIKELEKAIEEAASKNVLMFCAATDLGAFKDRSYPAASGTKKIFKIGAAEPSGTALKWHGDHSAVDFIFPGQVSLDTNATKSAMINPSSVATALASGLTAVILYTVLLGSAFPRPGRQLSVALEEYRALKAHERMLQALRHIGTTKESEQKFITVWNKFAKTVKNSENREKEEWIELVAKLAEDLKREQD